MFKTLLKVFLYSLCLKGFTSQVVIYVSHFIRSHLVISVNYLPAEQTTVKQVCGSETVYSLGKWQLASGKREHGSVGGFLHHVHNHSLA